MGRKSGQIAVLRYALMLAVLSLGLSGCQTCQNIAGKLGLGGRKPAVIESPPSEPIAPIATPTPAPTPVAAPTEPVRPTAEPTLEQSLQTVYFDYDSAVLRDDTRRLLDKNAEWLKANPAVRVQIEGHCDERGTEEYNLALGERRANSVKQYVIKAGVDGARVFTISYGKQRPVDPGHDEAAWSKNRRAQFSRY